jgi:monovalent cation:H+ antiporter, CPA1 family
LRRSRHEAHQPIALFVGTAAVAIGLVLCGRALAVYPLCGLFRGSSLKVDRRHQHVLVWGGLRGALALALALALPDSVPERREIIVAAFAVVAFSVFVQGLTMPWLVRRLALAPSDSDTNVRASD